MRPAPFVSDIATRPHPNLVVWRGSTWEAAPGWPSDGFAKGVACATATMCFVVAQGNILMRYNAGSWARIADFPAPDLMTFTCSSPTSCWGTGGFPTATYTFDGSRWGTSPTTSPAASPACDVSTSCRQISCPPDGEQCMAVFGSDIDGYVSSLTTRAGSSITPPVKLPVYPTSLACTSIDRCVAVGNQGVTMWDGVSWTPAEQVFGPQPINQGSISCRETVCAVASESGITTVGTWIR